MAGVLGEGDAEVHGDERMHLRLFCDEALLPRLGRGARRVSVVGMRARGVMI